MIPLYDNIPAQKPPKVLKAIIAINAIVFIFFLDRSQNLSPLFQQFGLVPRKLMDADVSQAYSLAEKVYPFITSLFLHGGWLHIIGNMWSLWIFGDNVEDRLGHKNFIIFYLFFGLVASAVHIFSAPLSATPTIGASGAVAGVMGAYLVLYPYARIVTAVPIFIIIDFWDIPAFVFLLFWFFIQFFYGAMSLAEGSSFNNIAWWAHIGGFVAGVLVGFIFRNISPPQEKKTYQGQEVEDAIFYE